MRPGSGKKGWQWKGEDFEKYVKSIIREIQRGFCFVVFFKGKRKEIKLEKGKNIRPKFGVQ